MDKKTKLFLLFIFLISFAIRIFDSIKYPPLLWDEAALGYNAYSILHTGKDEFGQILPLIFKSFGDYKPGFFVYLIVPFIAIFGLNELSVRLPSIILGSLLPILVFFLIKLINPKSHKLALISALILTFNPYNIHFAKAAWETNILTFELVLASYFFFKFTKFSKSLYLFLSALIFGLTLYTYQAGKMISLFLILILFIIHFSQIKSLIFKKILPFFVTPLFILTIPIIFGLFIGSNGNRLKVVSLFSYPRPENEVQTIINETNKFDYNLFYGQPQFFLRNFFTRYFNHFSPRFLAFEGDWQDARNSAPYIGAILYPSLIFLFIGIFWSLSLIKKEKINLFFLLWLLVAPIPAALTRDSIQAVRSMSFSIPLVYFISLGILISLNKFKSRLFLISLISVYLLSFVYYSDLYYIHMVQKSPNDFLYGYKQAISYLIANQNKYQEIVFTDFYGQPYIYYLFYSHYDPKTYQSFSHYVENDSGDTGHVPNIDNINFKSVSFDYIQSHPHTLGIFSYDEILRQGIDKTEFFSQFIPLSPISGHSTFYAYAHP